MNAVGYYKPLGLGFLEVEYTSCSLYVAETMTKSTLTRGVHIREVSMEIV